MLNIMLEINRNTALAIAGICGSAFIGYCIYFDKKRRSDPDFKKKLRENGGKGRKRNSYIPILGRRKYASASSKSSSTVFPDLLNVEEVQKFFLMEVQKGEELLAMGNHEQGVEHLTNAIAVCGQPQQLLQVLKQTLPPPVFSMLLEKLPTINERLKTSPTLTTSADEKKIDDASPPTISQGATITDVDELE